MLRTPKSALSAGPIWGDSDQLGGNVAAAAETDEGINGDNCAPWDQLSSTRVARGRGRGRGRGEGEFTFASQHPTFPPSPPVRLCPPSVYTLCQLEIVGEVLS